jgi:adenosylcobinamide-GDP ribazoletransferase
VKSLRVAVGFLTVVPAGSVDDAGDLRLGRAWFPAVGALVGAVSGAFYLGAAQVLPPLAAAAAALAAGAIITGGLHLDGVADAADGLLGGRTPERRLEIMRDPRVGAFGMVALVLVLVGEVGLLASMAPLSGMVALLTAGALSRLGLLMVVIVLPYVREHGLGVAARGGHALVDLTVAAVTAGVVCLADPRRAGVAALACGAAVLLVAGFARRRVGGATGDVYGACTEVGQLAALAAFAALR